MFQKTLHMLIGIFLLFSTALCKINIDEYKETYNIFKPNKNYLSPFNGLIWVESGIIKNYYDFGKAVIKTKKDEQNRSVEVFESGDAAIELIRKLFKTDGGFSERRQKTHATSLLNAKAIGKILNYIDEKKEEIDAHIKQLIEAAKKWKIDYDTFQNAKMNEKESAKKTLQESTTTLGQAENAFVSNYAIQRTTITTLRTVATNPEEYRTKIAALKISCFENSKKKLAIKITQAIARELGNIGIDKGSTSYASLEKDITRLSGIIVNALGETADFSENPKYVKYFVHSALLSFLYMITTKKEDLADYFSVFGGSVLDSAFDYVSEEKFDPKDIPSDISSNEDKNEQVVMANFEKYCYGEIYKSKFATDIPAFATPQSMEFTGAEDFKITKHSYNPGALTNCAEITIYNFVRILLTVLGLYDSTSNTFLIEKLEKTLQQQAKNLNIAQPIVNQDLIKFFGSIKNSALIVSGEEFHVALMKLVSNIPGVKYLQSFDKNKHEFGPKNRHRPFIHIEQKNNMQPSPDSAYNFELAGCPSSFVKVTNYLFGTNFENFDQLCSFFNFKVKDEEELQTFTDEVIYKNEYANENVKVSIGFTYKDKECVIELSATNGHSEIAFLKKARPSRPYHDKYFMISQWKNFRYQNLTSCFPQISTQKLTDPEISNLSPAEKLHLFCIIFYNDGSFLDANNIAETVQFVENNNLGNLIRAKEFFDKIDSNKILDDHLKTNGLGNINKLSPHLWKKINLILEEAHHPKSAINLLSDIINKTDEAILHKCNIALPFLKVHTAYLLHDSIFDDLENRIDFFNASLKIDQNETQSELFLNIIKKYKDFAEKEATEKKLELSEQTIELVKQSVFEIFKPIILISAIAYDDPSVDPFKESELKDLVDKSISMINILKTDTLFSNKIELIKQKDAVFSMWLKTRGVDLSKPDINMLLYMIYSAETIATKGCLEKLSSEAVFLAIDWLTKHLPIWTTTLKLLTNELRQNSLNPLVDTTLKAVDQKIEVVKKKIGYK